MVNKEMKFLDNGDIRYEIVDETARSDIQTINTVLDTKADTSNVTALDTRVTGVEDDCYNSYAVGTASGTVASFTDGADDLPIKSLMIDINPVQDLHGYDSPWVAGGGKNLLNASTDSDSSNGVTYTKNENGTYTINGTANGTSSFVVGSIELVANTQYILSGCPSGGSGTTYNARIRDDSYVALGFDIGTGATITPSETKTYYYQITIVSGVSVSNIVFKPMIRLASIINDTYAPYENICPISGWTGMQVIRTGKNLLPNLKFQNAPSTVGIGQTEYVSSNQKIYLSAGTYTLSTVTTASGRCYYKKKGGANTVIGSSSQINPNGTFTITETGFYAFWIYNGNGFSADDLISFQLEKSTTATPYEPYIGQTISINWESEAGTVYGGKLDVLSGELTIDKAMVDLRTLNWTYNSDTSFGYNFFTCSSFTNRKSGSVYLICDRYATASGGRNTMTSDAMISSYNATNSQSICIRDDRYTTVSDFVASLDGAQLVYELATPITIQLTPHEVRSLLGQNNIFADTGDIDVEYKADTTLYIERLIESNVDRAEEAKIDAQNSATQARQSATNAQTSAQTASSKAFEASQSASQALTYKTDTESARDEAQSIVNSISANANQIDTNTENIASLEEDRYKPYVTDSASGAIASFTDGADDLPLKSLVVNIDPVQDLHGYDSPWVAGGGKNLTDYNTDYTAPTETTATVNLFTMSLEGGVTYTFSCKQSAALASSTRNTIAVKPNDGTVIYENSGTNYNPPNLRHVLTFTPSASGTYIFMYWGHTISSAITLSKWQVEKSPTYTGYAPYENICPISGWTGMTVNRTGKNLLSSDFSDYQINPNYSYVNSVVPKGQTARFTFIDKDTSVDASGVSIGFQNGIDSNHSTPDKYNWVMRNGVIQNNVTNVTNGITCSGTFIYPKTEEAFNAIFSRWDIMVELGSEATDYEPYNGITIPIDWQTEAGTVYSGSLDVLTGVLTVDRAMETLSELTCTKTVGSYQTFRARPSEAMATGTSIALVQCSTWKGYSQDLISSSSDNYVWGSSSDGTFRIKSTAHENMTADEFKAAFADTQFVYKLATPIEIQLTPHEVKSLLGANNIFADTGDSAVEYRADTKLYIERLTAPDSADMIADSNIVSGQYFMVSNALYKATTNIANGGQIIVGTNCTKVSLATALNEINA